MKALSLHQPYASLIAQGRKTIETRTWGTIYTGPLLICASKKPAMPSYPLGQALCVAYISGCRLMTEADEKAACCPFYPGARAWLIDRVVRIDPFPVKGSQGFFNVDDELLFVGGKRALFHINIEFTVER